MSDEKGGKRAKNEGKERRRRRRGAEARAGAQGGGERRGGGKRKRETRFLSQILHRYVKIKTEFLGSDIFT